MNPAFWIIVVIVAVATWIVARRIFLRVGRKATSVGKDVGRILNEKEYDVEIAFGEKEEERE